MQSLRVDHDSWSHTKPIAVIRNRSVGVLKKNEVKMQNFSDPTTLAAILQARVADLDEVGIAADTLLDIAAELLVFGDPAAEADWTNADFI